MPVNGRRKGAAFERKIAGMLRLWLAPDATGELWSVMRAQTDRQKGQDPEHAGEFVIQCLSRPALRFGWAIECKAERAWHESQLWSSPPTGPIASTASRRGYWQQAVEQASAVQKTPVLVVKRNAGPVLAILERKALAKLDLGKRSRLRPLLRFRLPLDGEVWDLVALPLAELLTVPPSFAITEQG